MFRSPHGEITVPDQSLTEFVLDTGRGQTRQAALADGVTGRAITYGELREQVRRTAAGLAAIGVRKGDVVGLCTPNSAQR
jgi:acyl-coenzyme A synthetase/AMP-(fatty) acid ligase